MVFWVLSDEYERDLIGMVLVMFWMGLGDSSWSHYESPYDLFLSEPEKHGGHTDDRHPD